MPSCSRKATRTTRPSAAAQAHSIMNRTNKMIACNLCFRIFAILCFVSIFLPVLPNYSISLYARLSYLSTFFAFYPPPKF